MIAILFIEQKCHQLGGFEDLGGPCGRGFIVAIQNKTDGWLLGVSGFCFLNFIQSAAQKNLKIIQLP